MSHFSRYLPLLSRGSVRSKCLKFAARASPWVVRCFSSVERDLAGQLRSGVIKTILWILSRSRLNPAVALASTELAAVALAAVRMVVVVVIVVLVVVVVAAVVVLVAGVVSLVVVEVAVVGLAVSVLRVGCGSWLIVGCGW